MIDITESVPLMTAVMAQGCHGAQESMSYLKGISACREIVYTVGQSEEGPFGKS